MSPKPLNIAAVQMVSSTDVAHNIAQMQYWVQHAAWQGAHWVLLPEYWALMGQREQDKAAIAEPRGEGRLQNAMREIAAQCQIVLFGGSIPLQSGQTDKVFNTMLVYDTMGNPIHEYDKIHLFGFQKDGERYAESDSIVSGSRLPRLQHDGYGVAQGICYDLRFPEFFRAQTPFEILLLPAAFTYTTGKAHWHLLLRARAVENQCYVVAAAQGGKHDNGRRTFGHSLIINPWGEIIDELPEGEGIVRATVSPDELHNIRTQLPALQHRQFRSVGHLE